MGASPKYLLLQQLPSDSMRAEVGVWNGNFSRRALHHLSPPRLHLINPWVVYDDPIYRRAKYGRKPHGNTPSMDSIYRSVLDRFSDEIDAGQVVVHRQTSLEATAHIGDGSLGWVYIDGNHTFEYVKVDLEAYAAKLAPAHLLCGDDRGHFAGDDALLKL
jgi:hypothetical protein